PVTLGVLARNREERGQATSCNRHKPYAVCGQVLETLGRCPLLSKARFREQPDADPSLRRVWVRCWKPLDSPESRRPTTSRADRRSGEKGRAGESRRASPRRTGGGRTAGRLLREADRLAWAIPSSGRAFPDRTVDGSGGGGTAAPGHGQACLRCRCAL